MKRPKTVTMQAWAVKRLFIGEICERWPDGQLEIYRTRAEARTAQWQPTFSPTGRKVLHVLSVKRR